MIWHDETIDELKQLWSNGLSAREIAERFRERFGDCTRNAVIGKLHRLGCSDRDVPPKLWAAKLAAGAALRSEAHRAKTRASRPAPRMVALCARCAVTAVSGGGAALRLIVPEVAKPAARPQPAGVALVDLALRSCRWPLGPVMERATLFCGCRTAAPGAPYCAKHMKMSRRIIRIRNGCLAVDLRGERARR